MKIWESRHWLGALCLISAFLILAYEVIQSKINEINTQIEAHRSRSRRRGRERNALAARLREANAGRDALTAELAAAAAASTEEEAARNAQIAELERSLSDSTPECCYCLDAQATMSFVHGETAHLAACEGCAMTLAVQGHREICPICRAPFERIVRQFRP